MEPLSTPALSVTAPRRHRAVGFVPLAGDPVPGAVGGDGLRTVILF
ncbi:hypothetical protein L083_3455 [Actinoplanes sp. N902-109]|nr:hypothetical protein L083_3455 [Actinoplanes sp. N902-109]